MASGARPAAPTELGRFSDRLSFIYIEHARVDRDANAVTFWQQIPEEAGPHLGGKQVTAHVPVAVLGALMLGPGTRITHAAVSLLAASGCSVLWTGEEGVRLYAGAVSAARSSSLLQRQAALVSSDRSRLRVARDMYLMRFPGEPVSRAPMQKLRGREGARVRACYREHSKRTGVPWTGRRYDRADWSASDPVNRALSAANSALYGVAHAAILHLGCSPGLGFIHTGHQLSFVYDIADLYKAEITIPAAFDVAAEHGRGVSSSWARRAVRDRIVAADLLPRIADDIRRLLGIEETSDEELFDGIVQLWEEDGAAVPGGVSYQDSP